MIVVVYGLIYRLKRVFEPDPLAVRLLLLFVNTKGGLTNSEVYKRLSFAGKKRVDAWIDHFVSKGVVRSERLNGNVKKYFVVIDALQKELLFPSFVRVSIGEGELVVLLRKLVVSPLDCGRYDTFVPPPITGDVCVDELVLGLKSSLEVGLSGR